MTPQEFVCSCGKATPARPERFPLFCSCGTVHRDPAAGEWRDRSTRQLIVPVIQRPPPPKGPGTELKKILASLGIHDSVGCGCENMLRKMNAWGPAGCRTHRQEIIDHLREKARERGWVLTEALPIGFLVDRAISLSA